MEAGVGPRLAQDLFKEEDSEQTDKEVNLDDILELLLDHMVNTDAITYDKRALVKSIYF